MSDVTPDHDDLLRDLRAELAIEPSPEFAAKVRGRVASRGRAWSMGWILAAAGGACACLVTGAIVLHRTDVPVGTPAVMPVETVASTSMPMPQVPSAAGTAAPRGSQHLARAEAPVERPAATSFEVIAPPDQLIAIRRLMAFAKDRAVSSDGLTPVLFDDVTGELMQLKPIEIKPLTIDPLPGDPDGRSGGR